MNISRTDALNSIDNIIKMAKEKTDDILNSKWIDSPHDNNKKHIEKTDELTNLKEHLMLSISGIENLKHTYGDDMYTILKIESYIKKILSIVSTINQSDTKTSYSI